MIKELLARIAELESELEAERSARHKAENAKSDIQSDIADLLERLDEAGLFFSNDIWSRVSLL